MLISKGLASCGAHPCDLQHQSSVCTAPPCNWKLTLLKMGKLWSFCRLYLGSIMCESAHLKERDLEKWHFRTTVLSRVFICVWPHDSALGSHMRALEMGRSSSEVSHQVQAQPLLCGRDAHSP